MPPSERRRPVGSADTTFVREADTTRAHLRAPTPKPSALLYVQVFALVLRYRILTPLRQPTRHRLRVAAVVPEGPDVVSIEVAGRNLGELGVEGGQSSVGGSWIPTTGAGHPFSLSAPPTDTRLRLTVKALGAGSTSLQMISVGTWVLAEGPCGALTAARRTRPNVLLIAGGVGITPPRPFETIPMAPGHDLALVYRARSPTHLLLRDELDDIARHRHARIHYLVDDDPDCLTAASLSRIVPDLAERDDYLCGPPAMADAVRRSVRQLGLPPRHLHEERFEGFKSPLRH